MPRNKPGWYLILADLALILFLVTLSALASPVDPAVSPENQPQIAQSQALFRQTPDDGRFREWLSNQGNDPRRTLTIVAQHRDTQGREQIWREARDLADTAETLGVPVRIMISEGEEQSIYASLAFDAETPNSQ